MQCVNVMLQAHLNAKQGTQLYLKENKKRNVKYLEMLCLDDMLGFFNVFQLKYTKMFQNTA